jgi:DNA-binding transcriptional LysR family regulator
VRAGVGITVLPNFTVTDEIQRKTLKILAVEGVRLPDIRLMIVEARRRTSNANIERVRKVLEETLLVGSRHH